MSFSPPPSYQFVHEGLSEHSAKIYSVISLLSSLTLIPNQLHNEIIRIGLPLGIDQNDLAHAYYSYYWRNPLHNAIEVPSLTERGDEHDDMTCNIEFEPSYLMSPDVFSQALRTISPKEVMGQYYHHAVICHRDFDDFLEHVNKTLKTYFETPAYALSHDMNQLLNGIIKCICLRVLSSSSYYYAYKANHQVRTAISHLLNFYVMTGLIHPWNEDSYLQHIHMIRKYDAFKKFIVKILNLGPSFMSTHYFTFDQVTRNLELVLFDNLHREPAHFACESFPSCITDLKRNISSEDILHSMQSYRKLGPKTIVENGLTLLQFLANRIKQDNALSRDTKDDYDVAHDVFQMTGEAIQQLPVATHPREHALFTELQNEMLAITRFRKSKRESVDPLRTHSSQALIISPRMFRAGRNAPLLRASPPPVHGSLRASPPPVHGSLRVSPPPVHHGSHRGSHHGSVSNSPPPYHHGSHRGSMSRSPPPVHHGSHHGSHTGSHTGSQHTMKRPRGRGGARSKSMSKKSISKSKTKRSKNLKQTRK